jgi:hypothetical protein
MVLDFFAKRRDLVEYATLIVFKSVRADIMTKEWDIGQYCQDPEWKELMVLWKNRQLRAVVRKVDEDGLDEDNSSFLKLSLDEVIQAVKDTLEGRETVVEEPKESEDSGQ